MSLMKSKVIAGIISASMLFSSIPSVVFANNDENEDADLIATSSFETIIEEDETSVESTVEGVDENVTSIPADETEPTEVVTDPVEEPPIETSEVTVPSEETTVEETTEETTTVAPTETTTEETETTVETSEVVEPTEPSTVNIVKAESVEQFVEEIKGLSDSRRLIVETEDEIEVENANGVYFDGVYVISFTDDASYENAVAYFEANGILFAVDGSMAVNGAVSAQANTYKSASGKKVVVIDTGSNSANEYYSVIGDDTSDGNGHGTSMCNIVTQSGAYVISIKALGNNGKGLVSDVYAAVQLANDLGADYILLSMSLRDLGNYEAFHSLIEDTISNGTVVVASAGNNNRDASLYMPANISGVITVGALNEDLTKQENSNYGSSVNAWVVANSTSEAAAKYLVLEGTDEVYTEYKEVADITPTPETMEFPEDDDTFDVNAIGERKLTTDQQNKHITPCPVELGSASSGMDTGTAKMHRTEGGAGYIIGSEISSNSSSTYKLSSFITGSDTLYAECFCHTVSSSSADIYNTFHASSIGDGDTVKYEAEWTVTEEANNMRKIQWTVYFYTGSQRTVNWSDPVSTTLYVEVALTKNSSGTGTFRATIYRNTTSGVTIGTLRLNTTISRDRWDGDYWAGQSDRMAQMNAYRDGRIQAIYDEIRDRLPYYGFYNGIKVSNIRNFQNSGGGHNAYWSSLSTNNFLNVYCSANYSTAGAPQTYVAQAYAERQAVVLGTLPSIKYQNKTQSSSGKYYSAYFYGNGSAPTSAQGDTIVTQASNSDGVASFNGSYPLGWYYIPCLNGSGSYWCHVESATSTVVYYSPNHNYSSASTYTTRPLQDVKDVTIADALVVNGSSTRRITIAGNDVENRHFCIDPAKWNTSAPSWSNDYVTANGSGNATYANLNTILTTTAIGRVTGSSNEEKVKNLCKILYAWNGVTRRVNNSVNTTYSTERLQQYLWYLVGESGYGSYNIATVPTYTPYKYRAGTATTFNNVRYNGSALANGREIDISHSGDFVINVGGNFNSTNYEVLVNNVVGGSGHIQADIIGSDIWVTIDPATTSQEIRNASIRVRNKVDLTSTGTALSATANLQEYYGFSVANNGSSTQQRRFTAYYYATLPYYDATFSFTLSASQSIGMIKASANPGCTSGNNNYSLNGTTYKVYDNWADIASDTTYMIFYSDATGKMGDIDGLAKYVVIDDTAMGALKFGEKFYIKEVAPGPGYELDPNVYEVTVGAGPANAPTVRVLSANGTPISGASVSVTKSGDIYYIHLTDTPVLDPFYFQITKENTSGQITNAQLSGVVYRFEVYAEEIADTASVSGKTPKAVYDFTPTFDVSNGTVNAKVDLDYIVNHATLVSGDASYLQGVLGSAQSDNEFPLGTYRLYEQVAPKGFEKNNQVVRFIVKYDETTHQAYTVTRVEGNDQYNNNRFTYRPDPNDPDGVLIIQNESPTDGYYRLQKALEDTIILSNPYNRFTYEIYNKGTGELIATGTIPAQINGEPNTSNKILWRYDPSRDYFSPLNPTTNLKGTYTTILTLPVYNVNNGTQVKIQYEVREYIPNSSRYYDGTQIPYTYTAPAGWTWNTNGYYTHTVEMRDGDTFGEPFTETVVNNIEKANISISKDKPTNDYFDLSKVKFYLYNTDQNVEIAVGTVDANGNITFVKDAKTGLGLTLGDESSITSINTVKYLPLGNYRIEEVWDKEYLRGIDSDTQTVIEYFESNISAGWERSETTDKVTYSYNFALTIDDETLPVGSANGDRNVLNQITGQDLTITKTVTVAGDASTVTFDVYYIMPSNGALIKVAEAEAVTNGVGTFKAYFTKYDGYKISDDASIIYLPAGQYEVRERVPETTYVRQDGSTTNFAYTYVAPIDENGQKWTIHFIDDIHADYFYRTITLANEDSVSLDAKATNTRIESSLKINKMHEGNMDLLGDGVDFEFEVYYRGNEATAQNIGVFTDEYFVEHVVVHCVNGSGTSAELTKLPEGWYEIREVNATNWKPSWMGQGQVTGANTKVVRANSNGLQVAQITITDGVVLFGTVIDGLVLHNTIWVKVELDKLDRWTRALIHDASKHPENVHLTFHLYKDLNNNQVLDDDELEQCVMSTDLDDDGTVAFKEVPAGSYIIREVATVNGYYLTAADVAFTVDTPTDVLFNADTPDNFQNQPYTEPVKVTKIDNETSEKLSGAVFNVYVDVNGNGKYDADVDTIAEIWEDLNDNGLVDDGELTPCEMIETSEGVYESNGELHFNDGSAQFGTQYILVETSAPANYFFVSEDGTFTTENTEVVFKVDPVDTTANDFKVGTNEFTLKNQTGTVFIYKVDEDGKFLSGCIFKIYTDAECVNEFGTLVEDTENKVYYYKGLGLGTYYLVETATPEKYDTDPTVYTFEITLDSVHPVVINREWVEQNGLDYDEINAKFEDGEVFINFPPIVMTTLLSDTTGEHVSVTDENIKLVDTLEYRGLHVGEEYEIKCTLYDTVTGEEYKDAEGNTVTATATFTPETSTGTTEVEFEFKFDGLTVTVVAFEELYREGKLVGVHADLEDDFQQVDFPDIHTTFYCVDFTDIIAGEEHIGKVADSVTLTDIVEYENLTPGLEYVVTGVVYDKETGAPLEINGEIVTASTTFTPSEKTGTVEVVFENVNTSGLRGKTIVAFETLTYNDIVLVIHADIDDVDQTIKFPDIHTTLRGEDDVVRVDEEVTLIDTVAYSNLIPGKEYTVVGCLMDKATNSPILVNGKSVTASATFTPEAEEGTVDVIFKLNSSALRGKTIVAFETLMYEGVEVVIHADINDENQTVTFPDARTTLFDTTTGEKMVALGEKITLTDIVTYENLTPGKEYTIEGVIKYFGEDGEDNPTFTAKTTFVPETANGEVEVVFKDVDTTMIAGKTMVAFETIKYNGKIVVAHANIDDKDQTVYVADVHTTAKDIVDGDNIIDGTSKDQTVVDTVYYENLLPGHEYTVTGKLVVKRADGVVEYATDANGKVIEASTTFTPTSSTGSVDVVLEHIDASKYAGKKLVAFETLSYEDVTLAIHADIEDEAQTINVSLILHVQIAKADKDNVAYYLKDAEITIYYVELDENGELMKNEDGTIAYKVAKDVNGNDCIGMTDENGNVDFSIYYDENYKYFAKETKAPAGYNICEDYFELVPDENRESLGTCLIKVDILDAIIIIPPKTGDNMNLRLITVIAVLAMVGALGCVMFLRKNKKVTESDIKPLTGNTDAIDNASDEA